MSAQHTPSPLRRDGESIADYRVRCGWDAPQPTTLQPYPADLDDWAYSQPRVRQMLADAHAHYEAQVRPLGGLAEPDADAASQVLDALRFAVRNHERLTPADIERMRSIIARATGGAS